MKKLILTFYIIFCFLLGFSQKDSSANLKPKMVLDFQIIDYQYINLAAKTVNKANTSVNFADYLASFSSPSMSQSLAVSSSLYAITHFGLDQMMKKTLIKKPFLDYLAKSIIWSGTEYVLNYIPLGNGWLHEEYHRAVLTTFYVKSFNDMNTFPVFSEAVSVNHVTDNDLIRFKAESNPNFVRLQEAGIEGEFMLTYQLQKYNFFYNQKQSYFTSNMLSILNSFAYVWICHTEESEIFTNEFNAAEGTNVEVRDFTGLDFLGWTYDLFHPNENYIDRGMHPSGVGIDRYIKPSDLVITSDGDPLKYLRKQGYLQLFNFVSPMLFGLDRIKVGENAEGKTYANFAFRHFLTSFGSDVSPIVFYQTPKYNWIFAYHFYRNLNHSFHGIEAELFDFNINFNKIQTFSSLKVMTWLQPYEQRFTTSKSSLRALVDFKFKIRVSKIIFPYFQLVAKTNGWVAGNVFLENNLSFKFGVNINLNSFSKK